MPLYEFKCHKCSKVFERRLTVDKRNDIIKCDECGSTCKRLFATPDQIWLTVGRAKKLTYPPSEVD